MPSVNVAEKETIMRVQEIHDRLHHASSHEMTHVITANPRVFNADAVEIKLWKEKTGQYCTGCIKEAMKEHAKYQPSKPLSSIQCARRDQCRSPDVCGNKRKHEEANIIGW